jgi:hypothetical protein
MKTEDNAKSDATRGLQFFIHVVANPGADTPTEGQTPTTATTHKPAHNEMVVSHTARVRSGIALRVPRRFLRKTPVAPQMALNTRDPPSTRPPASALLSPTHHHTEATLPTQTSAELEELRRAATKCLPSWAPCRALRCSCQRHVRCSSRACAHTPYTSRPVSTKNLTTPWWLVLRSQPLLTMTMCGLRAHTRQGIASCQRRVLNVLYRRQSYALPECTRVSRLRSCRAQAHFHLHPPDSGTTTC